MHAVSLFQAKTHLSRIIESIVTHQEERIVISRHGKPVAQITALPVISSSKRIGIACGRFDIPDDIDQTNETIATIFGATAGASA